MALFRPYQRDESKRATSPSLVTKAEPVGSPHQVDARATNGATAAPRPAADGAEHAASRQPARKDRPTPTRRQQEQARMERLHPVLTPKEAKQAQRRADSERRARAMDAVEMKPERVLLRNYVDNGWHIGEFTMPVMILLLAISFAATAYPPLLTWMSAAMWAFLIAVIVDLVITWQRFKRVLRERIPNGSPKGLLLYCINRTIQIRRFRTPPPAIKRGAGY